MSRFRWFLATFVSVLAIGRVASWGSRADDAPPIETAVSAAMSSGQPGGAEAANLLRNGSFEGALLYWHNVRPETHRLVDGGRSGRHALRIERGYVTSAPVVLRRGERYTISFDVRADRPTPLHVSMHPSAREDGQRAKRLWSREGAQRGEATTEWKRVALTFAADVPPSGFWPLPHYMVQIGDASAPIEIDGVVVSAGEAGVARYVPRRAVEIVAECPDLPGYAGSRGNLFEPGDTVRMTAHVFNPNESAREVVVRWQLFDYEGRRAVGEPVERRLTLGPGETRAETVPLKLTATGTVLARLSVFDGSQSAGAGAAALDSSDFPLTSLPYPKAATRPEYRERFGGSFAGGLGCVEKFQRIGLGWIRWRPHANGRDHLPDPPEPGQPWKWRWFDAQLDEQEARGCSSHICLYPPPDWIMEKGHPLPKDMRWAADDPKWEDLSVETIWDRFVAEAVAHYKGRAVVYEIENEPELDHWYDRKLVGEYVKFTIRTARRIKAVDPEAKVMVNNVYAIPSGLNAALFASGGLKHVDIMSWHDYHSGWLADAATIRRMRQKIDEAGGRHVEIWFNEGWAFTNTAVDEPIACTDLGSAESTNAIACSVAELTANGQDKTILFHTAYETHGMSFWDYSGPGTMLWDWYDLPLPLVPMWNVLAHHIGLSERVGFVRPPGANFCIFDDHRNRRGVMIAYADRDATDDVPVELPDFGAPLIAEDIMGNAAPASAPLVLSRTGRPVILYTASGTAGGVFLERLAPLDRKHAGFVETIGEGQRQWSLPSAWEGREKGQSAGSVIELEGRPVWKLEQLWPPDWKQPGNFRPMVWTGTEWNVAEGGFGGQPGASLEGRSLKFGTRAPHGNPPARRTAGVTFVAPSDGTYRLSGTVSSRIWDGKNDTKLLVLRRSGQTVEQIASVTVAHGGQASLDTIEAVLSAGDALTLLPEIEGMFCGGTCSLSDLKVRQLPGNSGRSQPGAAALATVYRLPAAWEGTAKGKPDGNPIAAGGAPIWRLDRVWPDKPSDVQNYAPMPWDGTAWHPEDHQQGGQPSARVENGTARLSVAGPWTNHEFQKLAALVFIAQKEGVYRVSAKASSRPWTGKADSFRLLVLKKDAQRAVEAARYDLPRDGRAVPIDLRIELRPGHELVFLPIMPDWNNATNITIEALELKLEAE